MRKIDIVRKILEDYPETRNDDIKLYCQYAVVTGVILLTEYDFLYRTMKKVGPPESIRRSRQTIVAEDQTLGPTNHYIAKRRNEMADVARITFGKSVTEDDRWYA